MKFEIVGHDGFDSQSGKPKTFVVNINGRPYPIKASMTLGKLVESIQAGYSEIETTAIVTQEVPRSPEVIPNKGQRIERGDFVRCVGIAKDVDGNPISELHEVGKEYEVVDIHAKNGKVYAYEVIDQSSDWRQRTGMMAQDVELARKGVKLKQAPVRPSVIKKCNCGEPGVLELIGDEYVGECEQCKRRLSEPRAKETIAAYRV